MAIIKISSNPYEKKISYAILDRNNCWKEINEENNPNSKLLGRDFHEKFFPFCVKDIVDEIYNSYNSSKESITIYFEGSPDEFEELKSYCDMHPEKKVSPEYLQDNKLANAKELLPEIIKIFNEVRPLVSEEIRRANPSIDNDLDKFSDASNDIVPLCVVGNYSSGKSSFINALIGKDILPIGDKPVTAKVYKIQNSKNKNRASVKFSFSDKDLEILFDSNSCKLKPKINDKRDFLVELKRIIEENKGDLSSKIRQILKYINNYKENEPEENVKISDLVEVSIDFSGDVWDSLPNRFVIFDTPGSNSASDETHLKVLMKSMKGLSNGLPIFVINNDKWETTDNDKLCKDIKGLEALDNRFSMIVVNKADSAAVPKNREYEADEVNHILSYPFSKSLYSMGIFYLSSIVGLGAKLDGNFGDSEEENSPGDVFELYKAKYLNPDKNLYKYNIMPEQIKKRFKTESENYKGNLLYSNSGLFAIEYAIKLFAEKYSAYNKCTQSKKFLENIIEITKKELDRKKEETKKKWKELESEMDDKKKELIEEIKNDVINICNCQDEYNIIMTKYLQQEKNNAGCYYDAEYFTKLKYESDDQDMFLEKVKKTYQDCMQGSLSYLEECSIDFWQKKKENIEEVLKKYIGGNKIDYKYKNILNETVTKYEEMKFPAYKWSDILFNVVNLGVPALLKWRDHHRFDVLDQLDEKLPEKLEELKSKHYCLFDKWSEALLDEICKRIIELNPDLKAKSDDYYKKTKEIEVLESNLNKLEEFNISIKSKMALPENRSNIL
jgi:hypothetical protein